MRKTLGLLFASALLVTSVSFAKPKVAPAGPQAPAPPPRGKGRFLSAHPLAGQANAGYCYIDVPHVHDYLPDRPALYQQKGDNYVFTGDPVPFGYQGDKTVFYGHHPVPLETESAAAEPAPTFCFMKGPHYHEYPPPEAPGFKVKDKAVFYVGPIPPPVAALRPQVEQALEAEYRPYAALRPQVVVTPPTEWQGVVWVAPPAPTVVIAPPPSVIVAAPPPVVVVPRSPTIVIGAPAPVFFMGGKGKGKGWKGGKGWGGYGRGRGHWKH